MREKFVVPTMWLIQQLNDIGKYFHGRATKYVISFSEFLADKLDWVEEATMKPWDFTREWNKAMAQIVGMRYGFDPQQNLTAHLLKHMPQERLQELEEMMPVFAEDLCGKVFAEVVALCKEDDIGANHLNHQFAHKAAASQLPEVALYWFIRAINEPTQPNPRPPSPEKQHADKKVDRYGPESHEWE